MTTKKTTDKTEATGNRVAAVYGTARENVSQISEAFTTGGKAYFAGVVALGRAIGEFGRETATEFGQHAKATLEARSIRDVAELQAGWVQHRVETATAHAKELADLAREKTEDVIEPFAALLKQGKAA